MTSAPPARPHAGLSWSWSKAGLGLVDAAPASILTAVDPERRPMLAVGVLSAAAVGRAPASILTAVDRSVA